MSGQKLIDAQAGMRSSSLFEEGLVTLTEATKLPWLPRRMHISTLIRWAKQGLHGVVLETVRCGDALCTSSPAMQRFMERLTQLDAGTDVGARTPTQSQRAADQAERQLAASGI